MSNFQKQIYEQLDKLDDYLSGKNPSERMAYGLICGIVLAVIVYFLFFDLSANYKGEKEIAYNEINTKVIEENEYIDSMENGGFQTLERQISGINTSIEQARADLSKLETFKKEVFDYSKNWFLTFDDASKSAVDLGLTVNGTNVEMNDSDEASLGGMKYSSFLLFGTGKFPAILKYIDWLEQYGKFISIDSIIVESKDNRLDFSVAIKNFRGGA